jgi:hypothetical protein
MLPMHWVSMVLQLASTAFWMFARRSSDRTASTPLLGLGESVKMTRDPESVGVVA